VVDDELLPIGVVSRRTGLTIKAIRFYADRGIVEPAGRNVAGHRVFDAVAVAQLELVRTLRDLGLDLPTIKRILDRERPLAEVAAAQARAIAMQIEVLRMRQAVLTRLADHESSHEELQLMINAGKLTQLEQQELINEFTASVFGHNRTDPDVVGIARSLRPGLPDDPSIAQLEAWVEMTELLQDNDFRMTIRQLVDQHVADRAAGGGVPGRDLAAVIRDEAGHAIAAGVHPMSAGADPIARAVVARFRTAVPDDQVPAELLGWLAAANDPRRERYLRLLSVINEWAPPESLAAVFDWTSDAVRARLAG
jgi:DNA-binding transcriptional MerR regulator